MKDEDKKLKKESQVSKSFSIIVSVVVPIVVSIIASLATDKIFQNQEVITLEPRDGDVIIKDGNRYKLIQLIQIDDISMSQEMQESRFNWNEDEPQNRVEILKDNLDEDWSKKDSFGYTLGYISFNPNKIINLIDNIDYIKIHFDFYEKDDISTKITLIEEECFIDNFYNKSEDNLSISTSKTNIRSTNHYVTNAGLGLEGINYIKPRIEIQYSLETEGGENYRINTDIVANEEWLTIKEKYI